MRSLRSWCHLPVQLARVATRGGVVLMAIGQLSVVGNIRAIKQCSASAGSVSVPPSKSSSSRDYVQRYRLASPAWHTRRIKHWVASAELAMLVLHVASRSLRCFLHSEPSVRPGNKSNNFAPCGRRTRLATRLFLSRYKSLTLHQLLL